MSYAPFTLVPAYGRDYRSKAAILDDLNAGKDFYAEGAQRGYINREKLPAYGTKFQVRYAKLRNICVVEYNPKTERFV